MFTIKVEDAGLGAALAKASEASRDTDPLMRAIAGDMHAAVEENFEAQGPGWAPLKPSTIADRQRKGYWPGKILNRRGQGGLVGSITADSDSFEAVVGTNAPYGPILHLGGEIQQAARSNLYATKRKTRGPKKGQFAKGTGNETAGAKGKTTFKDRVIKIPPRPFLVLHSHQVQRIVGSVKAWLARL